MGREDPSDSIRGRIGRVLKNKWHLDRLLAAGGMGAVYAATHRNGKRVAIKMLHPALCSDPIQLKRFLREGYAANAIGDPRVVTVDDDDVDDDGSAFLVMELLEGASLNRAIETGDKRLSPGTVLRHMNELLGVLELAHAKGIVHRDIKPENLFVTKNGAFKVLDFGIARLRGQASEGMSDTSQLTIMGTPAYMAPEQAKGYWDRVDGRSDLWSVAATMFRLLSGRHVHDAETRSEQLGLAMTAPARSLASVAPELDPDLVALVDRALAYEMKERWPSAREMRAALEPLLAKHPDAPVSPPPIQRADQTLTPPTDSVSAPVVSTVGSTLSMRRRRRDPVLPRSEGKRGRRSVFLAVATLVVVGGVVWSATSHRNTADPADQRPNTVMPVGNAGALTELATAPNPSPARVPALPSAASAAEPRVVGSAVRAGSSKPDSRRRLGQSAPASSHPSGVPGIVQSAAVPPPRVPESNAGEPEHHRQDPLDRRR